MSGPPHLEGEVITSRRGFFWVVGDTVVPAAGDRSARPDLRPVGGARDRDEAVSDRVHPRRRRPGHRLPRARPTAAPAGRRSWSRQGYAVYVVDRPGHGRAPFHPDVLGPAGQPVPVRAGLCAVHELRGRADGAPDRTPPHPVAGKRRPGRPERPPVRRRGRLAARGLRRRARHGARARRGPARQASARRS